MIAGEATTGEVLTKANLRTRDVDEAEIFCIQQCKKIDGVINVKSHGLSHYDKKADKYVFVMSIIRVR